MKLYTYFQSSASYRVRIALHLKNLAYESIPVDLVKAEQKTDAYAALNPQRLVPSLLTDSGDVLTQSLAIMEYLEETHPAPALLPADVLQRAHVRVIANLIADDIAPLGNLKVRKYVHTQHGADETAWMQHWIHEGLAALEILLASSPHTGLYCCGDTPTMADCCLIPQIFNAIRWKCDFTRFPTIQRIGAHCDEHPAFQAAHPTRQPDAPR